MAKVTWKGSTLLAPVPPVMVSCGTMENANIITVAWCGILASSPAKTYVSIRPERHSYGLIKETRELAINLTTADLVYACDWCGIRSGRDVDKFEKMHLTKAQASEITAPLIDECPLSLECKVTDSLPMGSHDVFVCDIVAVNVDEKLLDDKGKLHLEGCGLVGYTHGQYYKLGKSLGAFGFSHAKKKKTPKKQPKGK